MRPQLRPRAAALVQRLQAEQTRPASLQALEGSKWGGPCAERGPHQRRESRPEPPLAAVQQSGAPSTGSRHADDEPRGRAGRPAAPQQPEDDAWCPPLARIPALQQLLSSSGVAASAAEQAASRSRHSFPGPRGQHDDGGALTPTSRGAPLSRLRHGSGAGRLRGGSPVNCAADLDDAGSAGRVGLAQRGRARPPAAVALRASTHSRKRLGLAAARGVRRSAAQGAATASRRSIAPRAVAARRRADSRTRPAPPVEWRGGSRRPRQTRSVAPLLLPSCSLPAAVLLPRVRRPPARGGSVRRLPLPSCETGRASAPRVGGAPERMAGGRKPHDRRPPARGGSVRRLPLPQCVTGRASAPRVGGAPEHMAEVC